MAVRLHRILVDKSNRVRSTSLLQQRTEISGEPIKVPRFPLSIILKDPALEK